MNRFILSVSIPLTLYCSPVALASNYSGQCLYIGSDQKHSFKRCEIDTGKTTLNSVFKDFKYQDGNRTIPGNRVTQIASGQYAKRLMTDSGSVIGGILLGPVGLVSRFFNRDYQQYVLDYKTAQGHTSSTVLRLKRGDAPQFQQELSQLTGLMIRFEPPQKETIIDVGPDL